MGQATGQQTQQHPQKSSPPPTWLYQKIKTTTSECGIFVILQARDAHLQNQRRVPITLCLVEKFGKEKKER